MLILSACVLLLGQKLSHDVLIALPDQLRDITFAQWALAALLTAGSFWAVGQYDRLAHKALDTSIRSSHAVASGAASIALGQTLGFGVVTSALARWRLLPDLNLGGAARLSGFVSITFVVAWALVTALACLILPAPGWSFWPSLFGVAALPCLLAALFLWPDVKLAGRRVPLPSLPLAFAILGWTVADTFLAAGTLFVLLPPDTLDFATLLPLFLIALGSGLISNTPGGVGPFELVLLSALPWAEPAPLLAAILAYRVIYYALPATLAGLALLRPLPKRGLGALPAAVHADSAPRSEVAVVHQNGGHYAQRGNSTFALWPTGQTMTLFTDPIAGRPNQAIAHLRDVAGQTGRIPAVYKCRARLGASARERGWRVIHMADEAHIDLAEYTLDTPDRRTLRRKLRAADKARVLIRTGPPLPPAAMARVDRAWQALHGRAKGGSMGRYCPDYVKNQWVGCAYVDGHLVAFATAHRGQDEWCLDIMRHDRNVPDGTMHALVHAGVMAARNAGATTFSLAATPACPDPASRFWRWAAVKVSAHSGSLGLRQFKSSFAPRWVPLYSAARSWGALALTLADIARAIHAPRPLPRANANAPHDIVENYEVASQDAA
ncbi:phosphatidylglycerol lysyltransferase domain-containing protein [Tateyamaria sp. SN3-11]|uniref:phosphatidylglycerol lysyltransferase domain-containing protein n=1 Tax=Tateyamaria sp. SN3-11 TaxID=3092147 RepID=UPI0039E80F60